MSRAPLISRRSNIRITPLRNNNSLQRRRKHTLHGPKRGTRRRYINHNISPQCNRTTSQQPIPHTTRRRQSITTSRHYTTIRRHMAIHGNKRRNTTCLTRINLSNLRPTIRHLSITMFSIRVRSTHISTSIRRHIRRRNIIQTKQCTRTRHRHFYTSIVLHTFS